MSLKRVVILGSTGSIGRQTLEVIEHFPRRFKVEGLAAARNLEVLEEQVRRFRPRAVALAEPGAAAVLRSRLDGVKTEVYAGNRGLERLASMETADIVVAAVVGTAGLLPTVKAVEAGKTVALANKETLVTAGSIVSERARATGATLLPVDSEHSAIYQCLAGEPPGVVERILLTASGGPFRGCSRRELHKVRPEEALKHPRWNMGKKITVDSATLMNKGLEIIEAHWLFAQPYDKIEVVIHPESIVHSMVQFVDGSVKAQLGLPDMRVPIQYALAYPERLANDFPLLDLREVGRLTFEEPDHRAFPALRLAVEAGRIGATMPAVLNAANEVAVEKFLLGEVTFTGITAVVEEVMERHTPVKNPTLEDILAADRWAREEARREIGLGTFALGGQCRC